MTSAPVYLVAAAIGTSVITSLVTVVIGVRKSKDDATALPVTLSQRAVAEAQMALDFKDRRLDALTTSEASLRAQLAEAKGTIEAQQGQITKLQSEMYEMQAERTELVARAESSERRARDATERLTTLEIQFETLKRKLELGP